MAGAAASAMIFVCLMVLTLLVGTFLFVYAAYLFLVVVQDTAAGVDKIRWPSDPLYDKLPRAGYLACMIAICLAPAGVMLRINRDGALAESSLLLFFLSATLLLWLVFPILLLSSLSAASPWIVFRLTVLGFLLRRAGASVAFFTASGLLIAMTGALFYFGFDRGSWLLMPVGAFAAASVFLIYARLLGRMAYLFDQTPARRRLRTVTKTANDPWAVPETAKSDEAPRKERRRKKTVEVDDPWAVPEEERRPKRKRKSDQIKGYAIAGEGVPEEITPRKPARKVKGYAVRDEPLPQQPTEVPMDGYLPVGYEPPPRGNEFVPVTPSELQLRLAERQEDPPPARPLISGVYSFPWYSETLPAWVMLALGGTVICVLIREALHWAPW